MRRPGSPDIAIGIDPGVDTGFAVWSRLDSKFIELSTLTFWTAYDRITQYAAGEVELFIENPNSQRAMYARTDGIEHQRRRERVASNIGSNRREASLLIERLQALGYRVTAVSPYRARKWDAEQFKRYTGYEGSTSQHVRDAGRLVFQV